MPEPAIPVHVTRHFATQIKRLKAERDAARAVVRLLFEMADAEDCEHETVLEHAEDIWTPEHVGALHAALDAGPRAPEPDAEEKP